jgi:hypothetical protein
MALRRILHMAREAIAVQTRSIDDANKQFQAKFGDDIKFPPGA